MPDQQGFEEAALDRIGQQLDPMADAAAGIMGMPPGGKRYSQQEIDTQWNFSPIASPQVRIETMIELHMLGKTNEEITDAIYPKRRQLITTSHPKAEEQIRFAQTQSRRMLALAAEVAAVVPDPLAGALEQPAMTAPPAPEPVMPAPMPAPEMAPAPVPQPAAPSILDMPLSMIGG